MFDRALNTSLALLFFLLWFFVISLKSMEIGALNKQGDGLENNQKQKIKLYQNYEEIRLGRCCQKKIRSDNATVYRYSVDLTMRQSVNLPTGSCLSNFYAQHSSSTGMKHKEIEKIRRKTEESSRKTEESSRKTEESSKKTEESSRKTEESSRQTEESLVSFEY